MVTHLRVQREHSTQVGSYSDYSTLTAASSDLRMWLHPLLDLRRILGRKQPETGDGYCHSYRLCWGLFLSRPNSSEFVQHCPRHEGCCELTLTVCPGS